LPSDLIDVVGKINSGLIKETMNRTNTCFFAILLMKKFVDEIDYGVIGEKKEYDGGKHVYL
jgi:hypothetical protein